jgi:hypothetical protein
MDRYGAHDVANFDLVQQRNARRFVVMQFAAIACLGSKWA